MADTHEILTELVGYSLYASHPQVETAIKTAAEQIKEQEQKRSDELIVHTHFLEVQLQQQRERVEKLKRAVKAILDPTLPFPPDRKAFPKWLELETALKELEG